MTGPWPPSRSRSSRSRLGAYVAIARPDHWFKNGCMLLGVVLALSYQPCVLHGRIWWQLAVAVAATCLIASSNYVLNEILGAPHDRHHQTACGAITRRFM
jgi:decaprenyl-phosphate phosphoribosyltransferase